MIKVVLKDIVNIAVINCEPRLIHIFLRQQRLSIESFQLKIYIYITSNNLFFVSFSAENKEQQCYK